MSGHVQTLITLSGHIRSQWTQGSNPVFSGFAILVAAAVGHFSRLGAQPHLLLEGFSRFDPKRKYLSFKQSYDPRVPTCERRPNNPHAHQRLKFGAKRRGTRSN